NGTPRRVGQLLTPGKVLTQPAAPGNSQITIADANQPTRILYSRVIAVTGRDQFYLIRIEAATPQQGGTLRQQLPRLKLVPSDTAPIPRNPSGKQSPGKGA